MARWLIIREDDQIRVAYLNLITGIRYELGTLTLDVEDEAVVEWIFDHAGPAYGDHIHLSDGSTLHFQASSACA